jgi:putative ABC transport system substrate-binding protein
VSQCGPPCRKPILWASLLAVGASLVALLIQPGPAAAQKAGAAARVGWLEMCRPGPRRPNFDVFTAKLAEAGFVVGTNLVIEQRFADCNYEKVPALAAELVKLKVDVVFTMGTRAARIVARTVTRTPLVVYSCDPFEHVTHLARHGGNLTGITCMTVELGPKRLEILKELLPNVSRVVFLHDPEAAPNALKLAQEAASALGITLLTAPAMGSEDLLPELEAVGKARPEALMTYPDVILSTAPRPKILGDFALKARLPTVHAFRFYADAGGLISYGATTAEVYANAAELTAEILKGARPGDLPLRQATRFELVINNKTAKALGITVPQSLLLRADEIIE